MAYLEESGITEEHFGVIQLVAHGLKRIIVVRNVNPKSTPWIERGYPPKPMEIKSKTSKKTGKVTAVTEKEIMDARRAGHYVIDQDGVARGHGGLALPGRYPFGDREQNEPGQVVHGFQRKAFVADYDLLSVIDPKAAGRNIVLVYSDNQEVRNRMSPDVRRVCDEVNARIDQPRLMHGAHDQYDDLPEGASTVFYPDRVPILLADREAAQSFYHLLRRQPITGRYW